MGEASIQIDYIIEFEDGSKKSFQFLLDPKSLMLQSLANKAPPEWTDLEFEQCQDCPLKKSESPQCPVALKLSRFIDEFADHQSFSRVKTWVKTSQRFYYKETDLQTVLFSMFGLVMATSGCPKMDLLRPMARFHLPFGDMDESIVRSVSMYLLRQYFEERAGNKPDYEMKALDGHYNEIGKVNIGISKRINRIRKSGDANNNSVTTLDCISKMLSFGLKKEFDRYAHYFDIA